MNQGVIVIYGRELCADTVRARAFLDAADVPYRYVDIGLDENERQHAEQISGRTNTPVVVLPDGAILVEPSDEELAASALTA